MNRRLLRPSTLLAGFMALLTLPLVLGFLGGLHPAFDSFSHFRLHFAALTGLAALPLLATRFRLEAVVALALAFGGFASTRQSDLGTTLAQAQAPGPGPDQTLPSYRLLHLNLRYDHPAPGRVLSLFGRARPDVITLNEVSAAWLPRLKLVEAAYPYRVICPSPSRYGGVAILSRRPFADGQAGSCGDNGRLAVARLDFGGREIDIAAIHLDWPWPFSQTAQVARMAPALGELSETAILAGDFNAVAWSRTVRDAAAVGGLGIVPDIGPTWLHWTLPPLLTRWAGLPIDQILVKGRIASISASRGDNVGSDHLPVMVTFQPMAAPAEPSGPLQARR